MPLPMLTYYEAPRMIDQALIDACPTYREAVRNCWTMRNRPHMTKRQLAEEVGCYASHVTDYLSENPAKRDLPARHIADFERACGNRFIGQWVARRSELTVLEEFVAKRNAA
jgi:hypothetical protein